MRHNWISIPACTLLLGGIVLWLPAESLGQSIQDPQSGFGSSPNSNLGQPITAGSNIFSQPLPAPSLGSQSGGATGAGGGATGADAGGLAGSQGGANMMSQNALNPFSGAAGTGTGALGTGVGGLRGGGFGRFGAFNSMFNNQAFQNGGFGQNEQKRIPTKLTVRFNHPRIPATAVDSNLTRRINALNFPGVTVSVEDRVAIVSGTVGSEDDRRVVDRFVSMEPGVSSVENRLEIREPDSAPPSTDQ